MVFSGPAFIASTFPGIRLPSQIGNPLSCRPTSRSARPIQRSVWLGLCRRALDVGQRSEAQGGLKEAMEPMLLKEYVDSPLEELA